MTISTELTTLLRAMDYPAYKDDLLREAIREGINDSDLFRLAEMTPRSYNGRYDVVRELKWGRVWDRTTVRSALTAMT